MKSISLITVAVLAVTPLLHGCAVGLAVPAVAGLNMSKNGPIQMRIEGNGNAMAAFKSAAIEAGGTIPHVTTEYAEANFASKAARAEIQLVQPGRYSVSVTSTAARSWDFEDGLAKIADGIGGGMSKAGFVIVERKRDSGL
jgi:hypothetical protein